MKSICCFVAASALIASSYAKADVILDLSPAAMNYQVGTSYNQYQGEHYYEPVTFPQGAVVTGMAIYSYYYFTSVNQNIVIDIDQNSGGYPGTSVDNFQTQISTVDTQGTTPGEGEVRAYAAFPTPVTMTPGETLWFSMSGNVNDTGLYLYNQGDDTTGEIYTSFNQYSGMSIGDVAMQLYGTLAPEPATVSLIGLAIGGLALRRKRT